MRPYVKLLLPLVKVVHRSYDNLFHFFQFLLETHICVLRIFLVWTAHVVVWSPFWLDSALKLYFGKTVAGYCYLCICIYNIIQSK